MNKNLNVNKKYFHKCTVVNAIEKYKKKTGFCRNVLDAYIEKKTRSQSTTENVNDAKRICLRIGGNFAAMTV